MRSRMTATMAGVAVLALTAGAVSACGSSSGSSAKKTMELIVGTKSDNFYVSMECGAKAEAKKLGVTLTETGPASFSVPEQKPLIDTAAVTKPGALLVAPTDTAALDNDLARVQKSSKLVFVDTASANPSLGVTRISSDNSLGGKVAADSLGQLIGGKGSVAVISVAKGVSTTDARVAGFIAEMHAKFPNVTVLPEQNDDADSVSTATSFIEGDLAAHPDLSGAFAANVITAQGAATGIAHAHKQGVIKLATFDADPAQMQMMSAGTIQLAIAQEPALEGADAVKEGLAAIEGKPVPKQIATPLIAITPQNMNSPSVKPFIYVSGC
ncbi:MAG TPA: ABC transporter substrate-binding protein [Streptosporangiaceae bacterium]|nr:ABC transporter substrate-binding protein [Streptosporangiaceae bacterium]